MKLQHDELVLADNIPLQSNKTKELLEVLARNKLPSVLILTNESEVDANLQRALRNLRTVHLMSTSRLNVCDILKHEKVLLTTKALDDLTARLSEFKV